MHSLLQIGMLHVVILCQAGNEAFVVSVSHIPTKEGQMVEFSCFVGNTTVNSASYYWFRRQGADLTQLKPIVPERGVISLDNRYDNTEAVIIFHRPRFDDTGTYVYRDLHLEKNICQLELDVLSRPQATCTSQTIVLDESVPSGIDLYCTAHGNPPPKIQWYRASMEGPASDDVNVSGNVLKAHNISKFSNGEYTCKVENSEGIDLCSANLVVDFLPEVDIYEPVIERETGEAVTMICKVTANPLIELADIIWTKGSDFDNILRTDYRFILIPDTSMSDRYFTVFMILVIRGDTFYDELYDDYWCSLKGYGDEYRKKVVVKRKTI